MSEEAKQQLEDAAKEVQQQLNSEEGTVTEKTSNTVTVTEGTEETEETQEEDVEARELEEAKQLYQALKNPASARAVVAALAQQAGILNQPLETPKEVREAKKDIKSIITEKLPDQYKFLADILSPAIDEVLTQERQESESRFEEIQRQRIESETIQAFNELSRETKGESRRLENRMNELSMEIDIGKMSIKTYINRLYQLASAERNATKSGSTNEQIRRNANDAPSRLRASSAQGTQTELPSKKMSLNDAVKYALEEAQKPRK